MKNHHKILLVLPPFWTPLIPPQGIATVKSFLLKHGYPVKTVDANVDTGFKEIYQAYFHALKRFIPEDHRGNFFNIGHDVLRNHMMAHVNQTDEADYRNLVRVLMDNTFFWSLQDGQLDELNRLIDRFFRLMEVYFLELLSVEEPTVVGLALHLGTLAAAMFCARLTRENFPSIRIVAGGSIFAGELPLNSPDFQFWLDRTPYIDRVFVGEGQQLMKKFLEDELADDRKVVTLKDAGLRPIDVSDLDLPDITDFPLAQYPYLAIGASFSCPYQCRFCNVAGFFGEYRRKSTPQVVNEFKELFGRYRHQLYFMTDALMNPYMTELAEMMVAEGLSMYMDGYLRVSDEACDMDKTILWRRGGLYRVRMGIESGSQRMLDLMGKEISVDQAKAALTALSYAGIKTTAYFVIGYPGETEADFIQTLDFLEEMRNTIWQAECNPFYYYYSGQPNADRWASERVLLYPESAREMLITQTWVLKCEPSRRERFRRLFRFTEHCRKLGIPNPYTTEEIYEADTRWRELHQNAVPPLIRFEPGGALIDENLSVRKLSQARNISEDRGDFIL